MKNQLREINKQDITNNEVAIALCQFANQHLIPVALSKGICHLYGLSREKLLAFLSHDPYMGISMREISDVQQDFYAFMQSEEVIYENQFRIKLPAEKDYCLMQVQGEKVLCEGQEMILFWMTTLSLKRLKELDQQRRFDIPVKSTSYCLLNVDSRYNSVTGLPNMPYFYELADAGIKALFRADKTPVLLAFNLIGFSHFNVSYSYSEGNKLLKAFANLLRKYFGIENCGHFNEDEFYAFTEDTDLDKRLDSFIQECQSINGGKSLNVRIGVYDSANLPYDDIASSCTLVKSACNYERSAKSHVTYFSKDNQHDLELENYVLKNFDRALKEGWIEPFYQPIVRILNGQTGNWEALARWRVPDKGILMNEQFVPILDRAGILYKMDLYMVDRVIADLKTMQAQGSENIAISVNLFSSEFEQYNMADEIVSRFEASGLDKELLVIEISNDIRNLNSEKVKDQIEIFYRHGFSVWVDSFGEGYSSISIMKDDLPISCVKFDASFITDDNFDRSKKVLKKMIELAEELGIDTVVGGVENAKQLLTLREIGCSAAQGYYFGQPLPFAKAFSTWVKGPNANVEQLAESNYYNSIGMMSLEKPQFIEPIQDHFLTFEQPDMIFDRYFKGTPLGFLEYRDGKLHYLRGNEGYTQYLLSCGLVTQEDLEAHPFATEMKNMGKQLYLELDRWIREEYWENHKTEWHYGVHSYPNGLYVEGYQRLMSYNPYTNAYAIVDVLTSYNANQVYQQKHDLGKTAAFNLNTDQYRDLPIPFVTVSPIYDHKRVVDMQYVYVNQAYSEIIGFGREELLGNLISLFHQNDELAFWMKELLAAKNGQSHSGIMQRDDGHWYEYVIAPASVPDAYSFAMINIDDQKQKEQEIQQKQNTTSEILRISEILNVEGNDFKQSIQKGLAKLGEDLQADRVSLMETSGNSAKNAYSWHKVGLADVKDKQHLSFDLDSAGFGTEEFAAEDSYLLTDPGQIKEAFPEIIASSPADYHLKNVLLAPFYERGTVRGFIMVENFNLDLSLDFTNLIELVSDFFGSKITGRRLEKQRDTDVLTGLNDRHPYFAKLKHYQKSKNSKEIGIIYMDLNGLKEANDKFGHEAGDNLLIKASKFITQYFSRKMVYRVGGDEFVVLDDRNPRDVFEKDYQAFLKAMTEPDAPSISVGSVWCKDSHQIEGCVEEADRSMQRSKEAYYQTHKRYR